MSGMLTPEAHRYYGTPKYSGTARTVEQVEDVASDVRELATTLVESGGVAHVVIFRPPNSAEEER